MKQKLWTFRLLTALMLFLSLKGWGQTNPKPFDLSAGDWTLTGWASTVASGSYPGNGATGSNNSTGVVKGASNANMVFWRLNTNNEPKSTDLPGSDYSGVYNATSQTRINGNGTKGFSFINTSTTGNLGAACLAVNTTNRTNINISWNATTVSVGARGYEITLFYRVGTSGSWTIAPGTVTHKDTTSGTATYSTTLPAAAENKPVVQIMWKYYNNDDVSSGNRSELGLDEIKVSSTPAAACTTPTQSFASPTVSKLTTDSAFTNAFTTNSTGAVTYTSSNTSVATVDANGQVTIGGAGTTTITANQAADGTYCAAAASYTLTVTAPVQSLTATPSSLSFNATVGSTSALQGVTVSGSNLTDIPTYTITGTDAAMFSATGGVTVSGGTLDVVFSPTSTGNKNATLTISANGKTATVALSGTATLPTVDAPAATPASNITSTSFTANWNVVNGATGYVLDVSTDPNIGATNTTLVGWNFPNDPDDATADEGISTNLTKTISTSSTGTTVSYTPINLQSPVVSSTTSVASNSGWNSGSGSKSWVVNFTTIGYSNIKFSSQQRSSNTGPKHFKVQYKIGSSGTWTDVPNATVTVINDFTTTNNTGILADISLPSACDNQQDVYLQWIMTSNTAVNGTSVAGGGTSAIDNISVKGTSLTNANTTTYTITAPATSYNVTGLNPNTQYYYRVRAINGSVTSANSNTVSANTADSKVIWNGTAWSNGTGPDATLDAIIDGDYNGAVFTANNLTVNTGKTLTVNNDIIIAGTLANNGTIIVADGVNFIQTSNGTDTNTNGADAIFEVNRKSQFVSRLDYIAWSSPVARQNLKALSPGTLDNRFYTYDGGKYVPIQNPATVTMEAGKGYQIRTPNTFPVYPAAQEFNAVFSGNKPNNGEIIVDASNVTGDYVFLGNPYPSALDAKAFATANPVNAFYIWNSKAKMDDNNNYTSNLYNTYNQTGVVPADGSNGTIAAGQGFLVASTERSFKFNNIMRTASAATFLKTAPVKDRIWLSLKNEHGAESQMLIGYAGGTKGVDAGFDARMLDSGANLIYSTVNGAKLIIDGRGSFDTADEVPLTVEVLKAGTYKISLAKKEGVFASQPVFIKNRLTGAVVDISRNAYFFDAAEGTNAGVLSVVYTPIVLNTTEQAAAALQVYTLQGRLYVRAGDTVATLKLYDMAGRLLTAHHPNKSEFNIPVSGEGYAVVALTLKNGTNITKKIKL